MAAEVSALAEAKGEALIIGFDEEVARNPFARKPQLGKKKGWQSAQKLPPKAPAEKAPV